MDLAIHPREQDLVVATHGRALYIVDDVTPLRDLTPETLREPVHLYSSQPAMLFRVNRGRGGIRGGGAGEFQGANREYGALITFSVNAPGLPLADEEKERQRKQAARTGQPAAPSQASAGTQATDRPTGTPREDVPAREESASEGAAEGGGRRGGGDRGPKAEILITDSSGKVIRTLKPSIKLGLNRVAWDFGREPFRNPDNQDENRRPGGDSGPNVIPGTYGVVVKYGGHEAKGTLRVEADPTLESSPADWQAWDAAINRAGGYQNAVADAINRIAATRKDVSLVLAKLDAQDKERERGGGPKGGDDAGKALRQSARDLQKKLSAVERRLYGSPDVKGLVEDETTALSKVETARRAITSTWETPSATANAYLDETDRTVREVLADFNKLYAEDVPAFQRKLADAKIGLLSDQGPIEVK
jgi:hypothetical protein